MQSVYGVWEKDVSSPTTVFKSAMRQFTLADQLASTGERFRQLNGTAALNWNTHNGWYFDLVAGAGAVGERVIASPVASFGFANVTTFEPTSQGDPCLGGGRSFFYRLDISGNFTRSPFANQGAVSNLPSNVPLSSIVASELPAGTIAGAQTLVRGVTGTTSTATTVTDDSFRADGNGQPFDNPCDFAKVVTTPNNETPQTSCPVTPLRVWRDLPRSQVR